MNDDANARILRAYEEGNGQPLVGSVSGIVHKWKLDWACRGCRRYGNVEVEVTGGPKSETTGMLQPKTTDEEFWRKLDIAHRGGESGLRICASRDVLLGRMWRIDGATGRMIIKGVKDGGVPEEYRWPPWIGREKGYW